jgi:hypothetical protein
MIFMGPSLVLLLAFLVVLALYGSTVCAWDDFFHPPSSESPLGGGLKIPALPEVSAPKFFSRNLKVPKAAVSPVQEKASRQPRKRKFETTKKDVVVTKKSSDTGGSSNKKKTAPILVNDGTSSDGKMLLAKVLRGIRGSGVYALKAFSCIAIIGIAAKKLLLLREEYLIMRQNQRELSESDMTSRAAERKPSRRPWKRRELSSRRRLEQFQKDQEECWQVLHSVYKKHTALQELVERQQDEIVVKAAQLVESGNARDSEKMQEALSLFDDRLQDLEKSCAQSNSMSNEVAEMRRVLAVCATKAEVNDVVKLVKDFIEQLKVAVIEDAVKK